MITLVKIIQTDHFSQLYVKNEIKKSKLTHKNSISRKFETNGIFLPFTTGVWLNRMKIISTINESVVPKIENITDMIDSVSVHWR